jgi:DNA polymerase V
MSLKYLGLANEVFKNKDFIHIAPPVPAGAPGPPEEYREKRVDLNNLFHFTGSTYAWHAQGDSMIGVGIHTGDVLLVDRDLDAAIGDIVIAEINRQPTVKRLGQVNNRGYLLPENPTHKPIPIDPEEGTKVWGVVTGNFHWFKHFKNF